MLNNRQLWPLGDNTVTTQRATEDAVRSAALPISITAFSPGAGVHVSAQSLETLSYTRRMTYIAKAILGFSLI